MTWNKKGIPHKGWRNEGETDLGPEKTRDASVSATCEMCGRPGLRYVHQMVHPLHEALLSVGRFCAAKMLEEYSGS